MSIPAFNEIIEQNDQTEARLASLDALRQLVGNVYPNKFERSTLSGVEDTITNLKAFGPVAEIVDEIKAVVSTLAERERPPAEIKDVLNERLKAFGNVRISGRLTTPPRGNFVHLTDGINKLQVYCNKKGPLALVLNDGKDTLDEENGWAAWQLLDHGDFIGVEGYLFITNTGELSVHVEKLQFLAKAMLPMPDKMHGIADPELQRRFRYADLIASTLQIEHEGLTTREVFERRAKLISGMRRFLDDAGFIEVETPMLTPKATGAAAKPFETHHNALDIPLYARVAPELYLKRLVVGGFEKVYELNRNFRNEGLSQRHNPEFTMLEFYIAYMDVNGMMDFAETMIKEAVAKANNGSLVVKYGENEIDFGNFERITMRDAVARVSEPVAVATGLPAAELLAAFEERIEHTLIQPTFIIDYPKSISPLSKADPSNPNIAERFELFINGMEVANGFSELNDPKEQYERFVDQMSERERGDEEAMVLDEDYIRALSYGMPPAAGIGIGIDRLVMLLTNKHSIRDVILFPHMRPEKREGEKGSVGEGETE
ncbi:MAG: lysine--tRNA ligase [Pyrinomonadaceae bacterium]|nr:lysine--tRNA ligase [Pyrinomonadaceae bacterium]MBP6212687.1 lysine--tRNA ligase [Pyrinomonadaceae bacterium]